MMSEFLDIDNIVHKAHHRIQVFEHPSKVIKNLKKNVGLHIYI